MIINGIKYNLSKGRIDFDNAPDFTLIEATLESPMKLSDLPADNFDFKLTGRLGMSGTGTINGLSCNNGEIDFLVIKVENSKFTDICGRERT